MPGPTRRALLRAAGVAASAGFAGCAAPKPDEPRTDAPTDGTATGGTRTGTPTPTDYDTVRVPDDRPTIQAGVDAAGSGDLVLVEPGTYNETVAVTTPGLTLRGRDRNGVVVDGGFERRNGVEVTADGVAVENLTARGYRGTGFYWTGATGFRGSFLTAYNNGYYGVYAYGSRDGRFEHSYASGHPDAGFYLGRHRPYEAVVDDVLAEHNAIGYSGTSTGADLTVRDSVWRHNKVGLLPNTLDTADPPQRASRFVGNLVYGNDDEDAPALPNPYPLLGMGVVLWGASANLVAENEVRDHSRFGVVAAHNVVAPSDNVVRNNRVDGSGLADLALATPAGEGNRFRGNAYGTSLPAAIEDDADEGSSAVTEAFETLAELAESGEFPAGDWRTQPEPGDQPTMPDPTAAPKPANRVASWEAPVAQADGLE